MITVDVYVPYLNVSYDFNLDETAPVGLIVEELASLVCLKERWPVSSRASQLELFAVAGKTALHKDESLLDAGVRSGQRLILC